MKAKVCFYILWHTACGLYLIQSIDAFTLPRSPTAVRVQLSTPWAKRIVTGRLGAPASSPEEDLVLTRQIIMRATQYSNSKTTTLDMVLSKLTYLFPLFVLSSAVLGSTYPSTLLWVNKGNIISILLALVMVAMGMTLEAKDFTALFTRSSNSSKSKASWKTMITTGVACQYGIMPLAAWFVGRNILLSPNALSSNIEPQALALFLGLVLVGSAPGGTASNLVSFIAGADVALSVLLTAISTLLASLVTPFMVQLLLGKTILIHGQALMAATAQVVLLPVLLGMILKARLPSLARFVSRFASFASVLFVSLICGGVVSNHSELIQSLIQSIRTHGITFQGGGHATLLPKIVSSVLLLHTLGFFMGYIIPKWVVGLDEKTARTMSIETGMQNSALAVVLAKSLGADPIACLPGAFSATVHSCLGSILAVYWRWVDGKKGTITK